MAMAFLLATLLLLSLSSAVGITLDFIRRDSPGSPSYDPSKTRFQRLRSSFDRSFSRQSSLHSDEFQAPLISGFGEYLMKISIGTPPVEFLGIADTGSDLAWIQCLPCTNCFEQNQPFFDPARSRTYKPLPCSSQPCSRLPAKSCGGPDRAACKYSYSYGDSSYTNGDLSLETITFVESNVSFPDVAFGCGHDNAGTFTGSGSGLIGLGGGPLSLINQLSKPVGGKFSYCLTTLGSNATSKISLGPNAAFAGGVSTPLVGKNPATFYYVTLEGFSVGGKRVDYGSGFSVGRGNIIIDSGTTLTYLPPGLYEGLESALVGAVKGTRVRDSQGMFKLCYESSSEFRAAPVTMHFAGADVEVEMETTFLEVRFGLVCLTMVPATRLAILGNFHQMNYLIGYDVAGQKLSFLKTDCSNYK